MLYYVTGDYPMLEKEYQYFNKNKPQLIQQYEGKFIVVKSDAVLGAYGSEVEAITETQKTHEIGTFLVQLCSLVDEDEIMRFHSRVVFADNA